MGDLSAHIISTETFHLLCTPRNHRYHYLQFLLESVDRGEDEDNGYELSHYFAALISITLGFNKWLSTTSTSVFSKSSCKAVLEEPSVTAGCKTVERLPPSSVSWQYLHVVRIDRSTPDWTLYRTAVSGTPVRGNLNFVVHLMSISIVVLHRWYPSSVSIVDPSV